MTRSSRRRLGLFASACAATLAFFASDAASARPNVQRRGGQWGVIMGGSACIPGKADCTRDAVTDGGITVDGRTKPSFGLGAELGYRFNRFVFLGAAYNFGLFNTDYEVTGASGYKRGYQNSVYAVVRPILPLWRFDFGLDLGPGFSRQTFVRSNDDKDYSQGFSFKIAPTIDVFITRRIFLGVKVDLLLNAHGQTCVDTGSRSACERARTRDVAPVHQTIFGLHLGGTFL